MIRKTETEHDEPPPVSWAEWLQSLAPLPEPAVRPESATPAKTARKQHAEEPPIGAEAADLHRTVRTLMWIGLGLLLLGAFFVFYFARAVFFPISLALILYFLLNPLVRGISKFGVPHFLGAILIMSAGALTVGVAFTTLLTPAARWLERAPETLQLVEERFRVVRESIRDITAAGESMRRAAQVDGEADEAIEVRIETPDFTNALLTTTGTVVTDALVVVVLLYFLLASGDTFLRKLVEVMPTFADKRKVVELARSVERGISTYLLSVTIINCVLGLCIGTAMWLLGLPNPVLWGVMAAVFNYIPYLGAAVGVAVVGLVGLVSFESIGYALLAPLLYASFTALEGNFVTPTILGFRLNLNPVVIFTWLLFWGWMWGIAGALLAVPMLAAIKIICDHIDPLRPVSRFLVQ
jgi:predicted PurR-regulated permease PerM